MFIKMKVKVDVPPINVVSFMGDPEWADNYRKTSYLI